MGLPVRLAILECDTPIPVVKDRHGTYGDCFDRLLQLSIDSPTWIGPGLDFKSTKWDVVNFEYPRLSEVDVILLTGSRHCSFGDDPWILQLVRFVQTSYEAKIPIIGICFGHQIIGRALGASVGKNTEGWEVSVEKVRLTDAGKELFGQDVLDIQQMHRDIVQDIPTGFDNLGTTGRCAVQGLYRPGRLFSLQGHPEFNEFIITKILDFRHEQGIFDDNTYNEALQRVALDHDGIVAGVAMCKFIATALEL